MSDTNPKVAKALQSMKSDLDKFLRDANAVLEDKRKEIDAFVKAAVAADKQYIEGDRKSIAEINKLYAGMQSDIASIVKEYMGIVRDTDGLTSVRPGAAKALDRFALTLDEKHLAEAEATLQKHKDEVLKKADKKDKTAIEFGKAMDRLIKDLG